MCETNVENDYSLAKYVKYNILHLIPLYFIFVFSIITNRSFSYKIFFLEDKDIPPHFSTNSLKLLQRKKNALKPKRTQIESPIAAFKAPSPAPQNNDADKRGNKIKKKTHYRNRHA